MLNVYLENINAIVCHTVINEYCWLVLLHRLLRKIYYVYRRALLHIADTCFAKCSPRRFYMNLWILLLSSRMYILARPCRILIRWIILSVSRARMCVRQKQTTVLINLANVNEQKIFSSHWTWWKRLHSSGIKGLIYSFI